MSHLPNSKTLRFRLRVLVEAMGRFVLGEPARVVARGEWDRVQRLAYRETIRQAAERGDWRFIEAEIAGNQLSRDDLKVIARGHTSLEDWPEPDDDLMGADALSDRVSSDISVRAGKL